MQRSQRIALHVPIAAAFALAIVGCSSDLSLNNLTLVPKPETMMRTPDWAAFSGAKTGFSLRPVTPADLVNADGQCAAAPEQAAGFADPSAAGAAPSAGGISLQMTECDVVRRAGPVEKLDVSADERGERAVGLPVGLPPGSTALSAVAWSLSSARLVRRLRRPRRKRQLRRNLPAPSSTHGPAAAISGHNPSVARADHWSRIAVSSSALASSQSSSARASALA